MPIQPFVSANKTANTITVRGTPNVVNILEKVIQANDRPRAEIVIDVEILEVNRDARQGARAEPVAVPDRRDLLAGGPRRRRHADRRRRWRHGGRPAAAPFNLNTISQGISTADFYLTVPQAVVKFLASDTHTRLLAKPQLRGAEGADLELNIGDEVPVPSTTFGGVGAGGVNTVPISVVQLPDRRHQHEDEAARDVRERDRPRHRGREQHASATIDVAGQSLPTFGTRKVKTRMRLREGESNLLAGLVREEDRRVLQRRSRVCCACRSSRTSSAAPRTDPIRPTS